MYWAMQNTGLQYQKVDIETQRDVWLAIGAGVGLAREMGLSVEDCTRVETVASELAHNVLLHGGHGTVTFERLRDGTRHGLRIHAQDSGPGIKDINRALEDGFTTGNSLGIGLGITKRMMDDVSIRSYPGWGTVVTVTKWMTDERRDAVSD